MNAASKTNKFAICSRKLSSFLFPFAVRFNNSMKSLDFVNLHFSDSVLVLIVVVIFAKAC